MEQNQFHFFNRNFKKWEPKKKKKKKKKKWEPPACKMVPRGLSHPWGIYSVIIVSFLQCGIWDLAALNFSRVIYAVRFNLREKKNRILI